MTFYFIVLKQPRAHAQQENNPISRFLGGRKRSASVLILISRNHNWGVGIIKLLKKREQEHITIYNMVVELLIIT